MPGTVIAAATVMGCGALLLGWAGACKRGTFKRGWVVGYRTPLTLRDDRAWAAAHRAAAPFLATAGGGVLAAGAVGLPLAAVGQGEIAPALFAGALLWALAWVVAGGVPAVRASRAAARDE